MLGLNIYYQNIRLKNIVNNDYEVIVFTETWLNSGIADGEFIDSRSSTPGHRDRSSSKNPKLDGGGVVIEVSREIPSYRMQFCETDCKDLWVIIKTKVNSLLTNYTICAIYLPPPPRL